jgi:hypothetical protein
MKIISYKLSRTGATAEGDSTFGLRRGPPNSETANSRWSWLYKISGVAALIAGALLLIAMASLIVEALQPDWISPFQNWLIVIFKLHAGFSAVEINLLHVLNFLDIAILALVGTMYLGLYAALMRTSRIWSIIALVQPFLGIVIFIATANAGRSTVMGAGLVISAVMLRSNIFKRVTAYVGILANVILLIGDFSAGIIPSSITVATLFGIGYVLLTTWFFLIAQGLFSRKWSSLAYEQEGMILSSKISKKRRFLW